MDVYGIGFTAWPWYYIHPNQEDIGRQASKDRLGEDPGLWYSNWHRASAMARELPRRFARWAARFRE